MIILKASQSLLTIYAAAVILARPVRGFGQRFDFVVQGGSHHNAASLLRAKKKDDHDGNSAADGSIGQYRERLERSFSVFDGATSDPLTAFLRDDDINNIHGDDDDAEEDSEVSTDQNIIVSSLDRLFNADDMDEEGIYLCDGDNCDLGDECKIPFKMAPEEETVDVMAFLGIQRAAPVNSPKGVERRQ